MLYFNLESGDLVMTSGKTFVSSVLIHLSGQFRSEENSNDFNSKHKHSFKKFRNFLSSISFLLKNEEKL